jgi:predicted  nucleic acid-binding Zn-ribbon protein
LNDKITALIRLQEIDQAWETLRQALAGLGPARDALRARKTARAAQAEGAKKSLTDAQVQKKNLELDIDAKDLLLRKNGGELSAVKSNDAYKALLAQMDQAKKEKIALEDQVLLLMETIERLQKTSKEDEAAAKKDQADLDAQIAALDAQEAELKTGAAVKESERNAFAAEVPADARGRYEAIRRGRDGFQGLALVSNMTCGGCRTVLPPTVVNEIMKGKDLVSCETCSRILYIAPKPVSPEPAAPAV